MLNGELGELGRMDVPGALLCPALELTYIQPCASQSDFSPSTPSQSGFPPETSLHGHVPPQHILPVSSESVPEIYPHPV